MASRDADICCWGAESGVPFISAEGCHLKLWGIAPAYIWVWEALAMKDACSALLLGAFLPSSASRYSSQLWEKYFTLHILMEKTVGSVKAALQKEGREEPHWMSQRSSEHLQESHKNIPGSKYSQTVTGSGWRTGMGLSCDSPSLASDSPRPARTTGNPHWRLLCSDFPVKKYAYYCP